MPIPLRLRNAFREVLVGFYLGAIDDLFTAEGFWPAQPAQTVRGERRTKTEEYYGSVDWNSAKDCQRILRVFEAVLSRAEDPERERLQAALALDGFRVGNRGQIVGITEGLDVSGLDLSDDSAVALHITIAPDRKGAGAIRRILGSLTTQAIAVDELRNLYGTGHGRSRRVAGLGPRHARLVARAAQTYVGFILETLGDPAAPWRTGQARSEPSADDREATLSRGNSDSQYTLFQDCVVGSGGAAP